MQTQDYAAVFLDEWRAARPELTMDDGEPLIRVIRLAGILDRSLGQLCRSFGINPGQFQVLAALRRCYPKTLTPTELGRFAILTSGTMTVLLDRLEGKDFVTRVRAPDDRRRIDIQLTGAGMRLIDTMLIERAAELRNMAHLMDEDDRRATSGALRKLLQTIDPAAGSYP
jgi:DNA-binding MarR family transcriptional regulator